MIGKIQDVQRPEYGQHRDNSRHMLLQQGCEKGTQEHDGEESCGNSPKIWQGSAIAVIQTHGMTADRIRTRGKGGDEGKEEGCKQVDFHADTLAEVLS